MLRGKRTYGELLQSPEGIPTNLLADRLERLERSGIIRSSPYQRRPVRYRGPGLWRAEVARQHLTPAVVAAFFDQAGDRLEITVSSPTVTIVM
jgi:hypothetical protein